MEISGSKWTTTHIRKEGRFWEVRIADKKKNTGAKKRKIQEYVQMYLEGPVTRRTKVKLSATLGTATLHSAAAGYIRDQIWWALPSPWFVCCAPETNMPVSID